MRARLGDGRGAPQSDSSVSYCMSVFALSARFGPSRPITQTGSARIGRILSPMFQEDQDHSAAEGLDAGLPTRDLMNTAQDYEREQRAKSEAIFRTHHRHFQPPVQNRTPLIFSTSISRMTPFVLYQPNPSCRMPSVGWPSPPSDRKLSQTQPFPLPARQ